MRYIHGSGREDDGYPSVRKKKYPVHRVILVPGLGGHPPFQIE